MKQCMFFIKQLPSVLINWHAHVGYKLQKDRARIVLELFWRFDN